MFPNSYCGSIILILLCYLLQPAIAEWLSIKPAGLLNYNYVAGTWLSDTTIIMVGNTGFTGIIIKSTDKGFTWSAIATPDFTPNLYYGIASATISTTTYIVAVDDNGYVYYSTDSGTTWTQRYVDSVPFGLTGVAIGSNGNTFASGTSSSIYKNNVNNLANNWARTVLSPSTSIINDIR